MILGIDAGNTNIVAALIDEQGVVKEHRYETKKAEGEKYHQTHLKELVREQALSGVMISSVVPEIDESLKQVCMQIADMVPVFVNARLRMGLTIRYDNPDKLGADLITGAVGAAGKYGSPVIIVDIGTATTISVVNEDHEYLGGMIAPGPYISMKALAAMTSQLPETELTVTDKVIGTNTVDCIRIGTLTAHAAMIDGMIERVLHFLDTSNVKIIATGGRAGDITAMCTHSILYDKNLLFDGLYELYKMNCT